MRIKELDGLRGIAILAVIDCHYLDWYPRLGADYGGLGVDLFFVLSGFLITSILLELRGNRGYFRTFYSRRALRIFPPYFLALGIYFAVSVAMGMPGSWKMWLSYVFYYASLFTNLSPITHGDRVVPIAVSAGLFVLWSLSVEELYYTFWAPVVRFAGEKIIVCILAATIIAAPIFRLILPDWLHSLTFYCRMDGLAFGSGIAVLARWRRFSAGRTFKWDRIFDWSMMAAVPLAIAFELIFNNPRHPSSLACLGITVADLCFALVTYALVRNAGGGQWWVRIFRAKWLRSLGMISYSLYLCHEPMLIVGGYLVGQLHLSRRLDAVCSTLLALALSLAIAYALWYGMESRILRWKDRHVPKSLEMAAEIAHS